MSLIAKESGGSSIPPLEPDVYEAICTSLIDLGTQVDEFKGEVKSRQKVFVTWAVADETVEIDGEAKPRVISREYAVSLHERARLRADLEAWRGKAFTPEELRGFDLRSVLGKPCRITTGLTEGGNNKVLNLMKTKNPCSVPEPLEPFAFTLDEYEGGELPEQIPGFIADKIRESPEYQRKNEPKMREVNVAVNDEADENVPF